VGFFVVLAACAAPRGVDSQTPLAEATPSLEASPSPSPTPAGPLAIASLPFHSGEVGLAYAPVTLHAKGGLPPYSWQLAAGSLPSGLSLSPAGVVSGSISAAGTFSFSLRVTDAATGAVTGKATVSVYSALTMIETCATKCVVGKGCSKCGGFGTVSKGLAPYTYKVVGGAIPTGMTLKGLSLTGGFPIGSSALSVQVTDKLGAHVTVDAVWSVYGPAVLLKGRTSGTCTNNHVQPVSCTSKWTYSGGSPGVTPKLVITGYQPYCPTAGCQPTPSGPPPGWTVSIGGGVITLSTNSTACVTNYQGYMTFVLRDPSTCATTLSSNAGQMLIDLEYAC
jgi:large repetitive protein